MIRRDFVFYFNTYQSNPISLNSDKKCTKLNVLNTINMPQIHNEAVEKHDQNQTADIENNERGGDNYLISIENKLFLMKTANT